jgi:hypothetical protein
MRLLVEIYPNNQDPQKDSFLEDDITPLQKQLDLADSLIQRFFEWLVRIKRQILAISIHR